jgi:6-phospho-3-hexuloisomerase
MKEEEQTVNAPYTDVLSDFHKSALDVFEKIDDTQLERAVSLILDAEKIFVLGIGHSGMFGRIFSMKLNHVGLRAYTVFDEINPPFGENDLFIAISQSGETKTIITIAQKAKKLGGKILGITSAENSSLGKMADSLLCIEKNGRLSDFKALGSIGDSNNQNLLGALFGFNIYVLFYTIVIMLSGEKKETPDSINARHANLQ